jgi:hypothetical protein
VGRPARRQTFQQVVLPILQIAVAHFDKNSSVQAYALEISHHVIAKVRGVAVERPENLVVILPQAAAIQMLNAKDDTTRQAAIMRGEVFANAKPVALWLSAEGPPLAKEVPPDDPSTATQNAATANAEVVHNGERDTDRLPSPVHVPTLKPVKPANPPQPPRDTSPQVLSSMQSTIKPILDGMVKHSIRKRILLPSLRPTSLHSAAAFI